MFEYNFFYTFAPLIAVVRLLCIVFSWSCVKQAVLLMGKSVS
ncbi:hypothetical protein PORCRE_1401 [Porphyromonas crevioricanis JCM 15906]|uniref:Uncharacterized protein n=1 Tax=Porphyromonas crevioricanis JCM 15906 TaxID=1305617 RepID=T1DSF6_9PORP|nr:hypothetical protein PORCRE_1401 [Porphyromonas crevioricanis JCM 15906]